MHSTQPEESRFRTIFRAVHAEHPPCLEDEWLMEPCREADGSPVDRPIVWSRRNGRWGHVELLWVGAAPGNAGGRGSGQLGAHGTRIPFGGDVAGGNLDVLLGSIGTSRNETFITAALNHLPARGGGEPTLAELAAPEGRFPNSLHLLRATLLAAGPRLTVLLGNIAVRATIAAARLESAGPGQAGAPGNGKLRLPSLEQVRRAGLERGDASAWPEPLRPDAGFMDAWRATWADAPVPHLLWLTHPSAQNMSPYARVGTGFHDRMLGARDALAAAARRVLGWSPPRTRPALPETGIYALPEWVQRVGPRHAELDRLWREKGV